MGAKRTPKAKAIEAIVMSEVDGSSSIEIGRQLNIPASTVRDILAGNSQRWAALRSDTEYLAYTQEAKRQLQIAYSEIAKQSLEQAEKQISHASYAQAMIGAAIATDKALRLNSEMPVVAAIKPETAQSLDDLAAALARSLLSSE